MLTVMGMVPSRERRTITWLLPVLASAIRQQLEAREPFEIREKSRVASDVDRNLSRYLLPLPLLLVQSPTSPPHTPALATTRRGFS